MDRCSWVSDDPLYQSYHDEEWGVPVTGDADLFECLCLEGQQAGLSWITVLKKREHYRHCFAGFDAATIAKFSDSKIERLLTDPGLIRNRLKLFGIRKNALAYLRLQEELGSFSDYLWGFVDGRPVDGQRKTFKDVPASTPLSDALSKELKRRGFTFVGSTICYAFMQAAGLVNDHTSNCFRYEEVKALAELP